MPSKITAHSGQDGSGRGSPPTSRNSGAADNAWGSFNGNSAGLSGRPTLGGGFGDSGDDRSNQPGHQPQLSVSGSVTVPPGTGESVTVTLLPEKEGMFMFQHHNYEVKTVRKGTSVVRRYSDFVWLLDCLQKRYPFRRLPLLPPKRVQRMACTASIHTRLTWTQSTEPISRPMCPASWRRDEKVLSVLQMPWFSIQC